MRIRGTFFAIALIAASTAGHSQPAANVATLDRPAILTVVIEPSALPAHYLDIDVTAYTPPQDGAVQAIVVAVGRGRRVELGRFGIFGRKFDTAAGDVPHRFRLSLPDGFTPRGGAPIVVRLEATNGTARGAAMVIGTGKFAN